MCGIKKEMKKILFVVSNLKVGGGAEKSVSLLVKGLAKHYDVSVLTFYDFKNEYSCSVKRHSFRFKYKDSSFVKAFRLLFLFPLKLRSFLKKNKFDLVVSNAEDANVVSLICRKFFKYKLWTVIRNDIFDKKNLYYRFNKLQKYADKRIVLTKALQKRCDFRSTVIGNALDISEIEYLRKDSVDEKDLFKKKTILMVGRFAPQKNHEWFFDVFRSLKDVNLLLIGNGPLEGKLRSLNIPNIYFLGTKNNVYKYLDKVDVFVLPSLYEGMPRVLMEALACGCVSVANDCKTGPRELLEFPLDKALKRYVRTKYGYLVPFNDREEFKKAIVDALSKGKKIKKDTKFSLDNITKLWVDEIEKD